MRLRRHEGLTGQTLVALVWRAFEKGSQYIVQLAIQVLLARMLLPEDYGVYAILYAIITLMMVVLQGGLPSALIQNNSVTDRDYSSVFWYNFILACVSIVALNVCAPFIASFFNMSGIVAPLSAASLSLIFAAYSSVQTSRLMKELKFKALFFRTVIAVALSGVAGIGCALAGGGVWALVVQNITNQLLCCIFLAIAEPWIPKRCASLERIGVLLSFGWKMCVSNLLKTGYESIVDLVFGRSMSSASLGLYNRGRKFAQVATTVADDPVQSVLFPALSKRQTESAVVTKTVQKVVGAYSLIAAPIIVSVVFFAEPLIVTLLTDKWLGSIAFFQLCCISYLFLPLQTPVFQALNALGRSEVAMLFEVGRLLTTVAASAFAVTANLDPVAMVATVIASNLIVSMFVFVPAARILHYPVYRQLVDWGAPFLIALLAIAASTAISQFLPVTSEWLKYMLSFFMFVAGYALLVFGVRLPALTSIASVFK